MKISALLSLLQLHGIGHCASPPTQFRPGDHRRRSARLAMGDTRSSSQVCVFSTFSQAKLRWATAPIRASGPARSWAQPSRQLNYAGPLPRTRSSQPGAPAPLIVKPAPTSSSGETGPFAGHALGQENTSMAAARRPDRLSLQDRLSHDKARLALNHAATTNPTALHKRAPGATLVLGEETIPRTAERASEPVRHYKLEFVRFALQSSPKSPRPPPAFSEIRAIAEVGLARVCSHLTDEPALG